MKSIKQREQMEGYMHSFFYKKRKVSKCLKIYNFFCCIYR